MNHNYKLTKVSKYFKIAVRENVSYELKPGNYRAGPFLFKICPNRCTITVKNEGKSFKLSSDLFPIIVHAWEISEDDIVYYQGEELVIQYNFTIINNYFKNIIIFV